MGLCTIDYGTYNCILTSSSVLGKIGSITKLKEFKRESTTISGNKRTETLFRDYLHCIANHL